MKNLILTVMVASLLFESYLVCSDKQNVENQQKSEGWIKAGGWVKTGNLYESDLYTMTISGPGGRIKKINGVFCKEEGRIVRSAPVNASDGFSSDESLDFYDDNQGRAYILDPEISDEHLEHVKNLKLHAPTSQAEHLAQKELHKQAVAELHANSCSYSNFISERGDNAVGHVKRSVFDRDSDDDSDYESNDGTVEV